MDERKRKLIEKLKDKEYREAFVIEHIDTGIPFQIHALREQRGWSQKDLGERTKMAQETISRIEDPNYGKLTLKTLKRLASAFDIGLLIRFVSFSELVDWELSLTSASLETVSFSEDFKPDLASKIIPEETELTADDKETTSTHGTSSQSNVIIILDNYRSKRGTISPVPIPQTLAVGMASRS